MDLDALNKKPIKTSVVETATCRNLVNIYIIIQNPQFWVGNNLCVGQKNSAFIPEDAGWNSTSSERTEVHGWCCLIGC